MKKILVVITAVLLFASCSTQTNEARMRDISIKEMTNTTWEIDSFTDENGSVVEGMDATGYYNGLVLVFEPEDQLIIANNTQFIYGNWENSGEEIVVNHPSGEAYEGFLKDDMLVLEWDDDTLHLRRIY